jgi:hypothetical protein
MMDYASAPAQGKGVAPTASPKEGYTKAPVARPPKASPPPTADRVDKMYHQLAEIHTIATMQLVECVRWHRSNPPWSPMWQERLHRHRMISLPKPRYGSEAHASNPRLANEPTRWARNLSGTHGTCTTVSPADGGDTTVTPRGQGLRCLEAVCTTCR